MKKTLGFVDTNNVNSKQNIKTVKLDTHLLMNRTRPEVATIIDNYFSGNIKGESLGRPVRR